MSAAVRTLSGSENGKEVEELKKKIDNIKVANAGDEDNGDAEKHKLCRNEEEEEEEYHSDEEDDEKLKSVKELDLGPQVSLKEQLEKDKDDDSLRRWKEQLLGSVDISTVGESKEPEVKIRSMRIVREGKPEIIDLANQKCTNSKSKSLFTLKEGSKFQLKLSFTVSNNIVSGLKYISTVWKAGIRVDNSKKMMGTFSPKEEPYTYDFEEETTPSGLFARGSYAARAKIVDDDGKCYLSVDYNFEIQKKWPSHS